MKNKLLLGVFLMSIFSVSMLFASGGQESGVETEEPVILRVLNVYTPDHSVGPSVEKINQIFLESHPNVKIEMQTMPSDKMKEVLKVDFGSGNPPHVFNVWMEYPNLDYIEQGLWYDFKNDLNEDQEWANTFNAGALDVHTYETEGIWGIPQAAFGLGIYYNKELFKQAGITLEPETMEDFYAAVEKILALADIDPMPIGNLDGWRSIHLLYQIFYKLNGCDAGSDVASGDLDYDSPEMLQTFVEMQKMAKSGAFGSSYAGLGYADEVSLFNEGKSAMRFSGSWTLGEVSKDLDVGFFPFPYYKDRTEFKDDWFAGYADGWAMASGLEGALQEAAIEYVKLWTSSIGFKSFAEDASNVPAGKADIDSDVTGALCAEFVSEISKSTNSQSGIPERNTLVGAETGNMSQAALALVVTPEEAVESIQNVLDSTK